MYIDSKCKVCRRQGTKLFLKGERCFSQKCAMVKRPTPPGKVGKRRRGTPSEYAKELKEKQKLKFLYGLRERQFKRYVMEILSASRKEKSEKADDPPTLLTKRLESRLDNTIFRLGITGSRALARQMVSHGYFKVNGRNVNIPSYRVEKGDKIKVKPEKQKKKIFQSLAQSLKKQNTSVWLKFDPKTFEAEVVAEPSVELAELPVEISTIFEFYSR
ncbi:MAG: 30S ribosomal protein S4 [bacterium]|nr:30S ribosomal protein S4 [bacterium]